MGRHDAHLHIHLSKKKKLDFLDRMALVASIIAPMTAIPQIFKVFGPNQGVSIWAWAGLMPISLLFFVYGRYHNIKPMVWSNFLWLVAEVFVVVGILTHR